MEKTARQNFTRTLLFYLVSALLIGCIIGSGKFRSGPCTPNLDVFSVLLFGPITFVLLFRNGYRVFCKDKTSIPSLVAHGIGFSLWILALYIPF